MPRYEYACEHCQHHFEVQQRMTEEPLKTCPSCKQDALIRLVSATSFALKGGGWYSDGYGAKGGGKDPTSSGSAAPKASTSEAKSDAKPEAKAEVKADAKPAPSGDKKD